MAEDVEDAGFGALGALADPSPVTIADGTLTEAAARRASASASPNLARTANAVPTCDWSSRTSARTDAPAPAELDALAAAAAAAAPVWRASSAADRAAWLRAAADALDAHADELVAIADDETRLGRDAPARRGGPHDRSAAAVRHRGRGGLVPRADDRRRGCRGHAASPRAAPHAHRRRAGRGVLGLELPLRVLGRGRRHRIGARRRQPGDREGALRSPAALGAHRRASSQRRSRPRGRPQARSVSSKAARPATRWCSIRSSRPRASPARSPAGARSSTSPTGRPDPIPFYGELGSVNPVVITRVGARGAR